MIYNTNFSYSQYKNWEGFEKHLQRKNDKLTVIGISEENSYPSLIHFFTNKKMYSVNNSLYSWTEIPLQLKTEREII